MYFASDKKRAAFIAELEAANGKLGNGRLTIEEVEEAIVQACKKYAIVKADLDAEIKITVNPFMSSVANSYKYNREMQTVTFTFKKGKIATYTFLRKQVGKYGSKGTFYVAMTVQLKEIIARKFMENIGTITTTEQAA